MSDEYKNVPEELKKLKQWVCYKLEWDEKKQKNNKIPKNPFNGGNAMANNPDTWGDYGTALAAIQKYNFDGLGIEFANGIFGIDVDHCIEKNDETGEEKMNAIAAEVMTTVQSYTETSPSGTGIHILCKGELPKEPGRRNDDIGLEMYDTGRFFTVTGKTLKGYSSLEERTSQVKALHEKYLKKKEKPISQPVVTYSTDLSDREVLDKMFDSTSGREIKALYDGDLSAHSNDHSRADQALVNHLVYWTNGNFGQVDSLFRQSGLMRPKWDEKRGVDTYGNLTIQRAFDSFIPYEPPTKKTPQQDFKGVTSQQQDKHNNTIVQSLPSNTSAAPDTVAEYLARGFKKEIEDFQKYKDRKTGYSNLDTLTSLYPGLYVIGAISSLGKTTFTHQLGDQLAGMGDHVLFFSLEQSRLEMVTKSLSRITAKNDKDTAVSAINIRGGKSTPAVEKAIADYSKVASKVSVIECGFDTNIEFIRGYTESYIKENQVKPIVIVDYLQIIPPTEQKQATKDSIDMNVRALKTMQRDHALVVFVISSLNRSNYLTPVDYESFKESGGIEYTADVIWGLQLQCINEDLFNKNEKLKEKRERIRKAKKEIPRKIELVCLKNRYGISSYSCGFDYDPRYDLFSPEDDFKPIEESETPFNKSKRK